MLELKRSHWFYFNIYYKTEDIWFNLVSWEVEPQEVNDHKCRAGRVCQRESHVGLFRNCVIPFLKLSCENPDTGTTVNTVSPQIWGLEGRLRVTDSKKINRQLLGGECESKAEASTTGSCALNIERRHSERRGFCRGELTGPFYFLQWKLKKCKKLQKMIFIKYVNLCVGSQGKWGHWFSFTNMGNVIIYCWDKTLKTIQINFISR